MRIVVLSSGSKGNTTYMEFGKEKMLIDAGNNNKYITFKLEELNVSLQDINEILLTHTHTDHTAGLKVLLKKTNAKVYLTKEMLADLPFIENYQLIEDLTFKCGEVLVNAFKTSHDASSSLGYVITYENKKITYVTDTGYINSRYFELLKNSDLYIMESNHDVEKLMEGKYPFELKKRILSDKGHLSNTDASKYLCEFLGNNTKYIFLAHLSEENNDPKIALHTLEERLNKIDNKVEKIYIGKQNEMSEVINL